jgi:DNA (cytosine-5)-methyltransferase 1
VRPRLLDLFCGAGGCTKGYQCAGFYVIGVDIDPQPEYCGNHFIQEDALEFLERLIAGGGGPWWLGDLAGIHASPPCQRYSHAAKLNPGSREKHPDLISPVRELLIEAGLPYVIENVEGARDELRTPYLLCGSMFGIKVRRHRLFETSFPMTVPRCQHSVEDGYPAVYVTTTKRDGKKGLRGIVNPVATGARHNIDALRDAMGVDWMEKRRGITESIPPVYTELIGHQLMQQIGGRIKEAA